MAQLIDTSVSIALERQQVDLSVLASIFPQEPIALAAITASELLMGVYYANTAERRERRQAFVERILTLVPIFAFGLGLHAYMQDSSRTCGRPGKPSELTTYRLRPQLLPGDMRWRPTT